MERTTASSIQPKLHFIELVFREAPSAKGFKRSLPIPRGAQLLIPQINDIHGYSTSASEKLYPGQLGELTGHKSIAMTKRYAHANEEGYEGAIEALDEA